MTTLTAIGTAKHPIGATVAVDAVWVLEVTGSQVLLGANDCPPGMFCGAALALLSADFSAVQPPPASDSVIDVYGTVTSDLGIRVIAYTTN